MSSKYKVSQVVSAIHDTKGALCLAAQRLGCARSTIYDFVRRYPAVAQAVDDEREKLIDIAELRLRKAVNDGKPWAIALVLKTLGKSRGYVEKSPATMPYPEGTQSDSSEALEWQHLQSMLLAALQPYPEARWAVVKEMRALTGAVDETSNGHSPSA